MVICSPPSPTKRTTSRSGAPSLAPMAAGSPNPIVPRPPEVTRLRVRRNRSSVPRTSAAARRRSPPRRRSHERGPLHRRLRPCGSSVRRGCRAGRMTRSCSIRSQSWNSAVQALWSRLRMRWVSSGRGLAHVTRHGDIRLNDLSDLPRGRSPGGSPWRFRRSGRDCPSRGRRNAFPRRRAGRSRGS